MPEALFSAACWSTVHNGPRSNGACHSCVTSVCWSSPRDTGYVLIICIRRLKSCIDINKERTVSSNHGFYIYLNHCRRVQADYLPHGSGWCLIGLCVEYLSLLRRSDRSTWSNAAQPPVTFARWCPWPQYHACCFPHPSWWLDFFCG